MCQSSLWANDYDCLNPHHYIMTEHLCPGYFSNMGVADALVPEAPAHQ